MAKGLCPTSAGRMPVTAYLQTAVNAVTDWILVALPIPSIWTSTVDCRTRASLYGILVLAAG
jgi:hypothetical protein